MRRRRQAPARRRGGRTRIRPAASSSRRCTAGRTVSIPFRFQFPLVLLSPPEPFPLFELFLPPLVLLLALQRSVDPLPISLFPHGDPRRLLLLGLSLESLSLHVIGGNIECALQSIHLDLLGCGDRVRICRPAPWTEIGCRSEQSLAQSIYSFVDRDVLGTSLFHLLAQLGALDLHPALTLMVQDTLVRLTVHRRPSERVEKVAVPRALLAAAVAWTGRRSFPDFEERGVARDVSVRPRSTGCREADTVIWHLV